MGAATKIMFALLLATAVAGCAQSQADLDAPAKFFAKHQVGSSPDYGIFKFDVNDHVITVHGFSDDLHTCIQVAHALNDAACKEITEGSACLNPYNCRILQQ